MATVITEQLRLSNTEFATITISMAHARAGGLPSLNSFRFVLGLGEAGNWPGAAKVIAEWFPIRQWALGMAIFNSGTSIGSVVAPLIIALDGAMGWQATSVVLGASGFVWLAVWLLSYHAPKQHPSITSAELSLIRNNREDTKGTRPIGWRDLLRHREVWAIVVSRSSSAECADSVLSRSACLRGFPT